MIASVALVVSLKLSLVKKSPWIGYFLIKIY